MYFEFFSLESSQCFEFRIVEKGWHEGKDSTFKITPHKREGCLATTVVLISQDIFPFSLTYWIFVIHAKGNTEAMKVCSCVLGGVLSSGRHAVFGQLLFCNFPCTAYKHHRILQNFICHLSWKTKLWFFRRTNIYLLMIELVDVCKALQGKQDAPFFCISLWFKITLFRQKLSILVSIFFVILLWFLRLWILF